MKIMVEEAKNARSDIRILWQFIALRINKYEFQVAEELAKNIGMRFFKTFAETDESLAPSNRQLRRRHLTKPCIDV